MAKKLSNPVAALISVPLQYNYDHHIGPDDGHKSYLNFQPVVPISLNADWNVISRTIVPIISQHNVVPGSSQSGFGDITQSLFFSPKEPTAGGLIWGIGPVFLLPTGTESQLSARKWGAGPTGVVLKQDGPWTYGLLANHIWGAGGVSTRPDVSSTFLQPFLSYTTKDAWTYSLNTESTYDWKNKQWQVPINLLVTKLMKFGDQPVSIGGGLRYWAESTEVGPHDLGVRLVVTFLFPK
ncbi:transporter [Variovorax sp. J22P271]|uniref:transporter n=1 Tax=Variovorax davisae TaxID=3053515 RepID=UPI0025769BE3|nr:transporter [Variovorax sp. J22P271]MDM0036770.1 transporter [Variovorax sp. J22P271]